MEASQLAVAQTATASETLADVHDRIAVYYTETVTRFGATPRGVDWSCQPTQEMRFVQLLKLCDFSVPFSLNDIGCGYGALAAFLARRHPSAKVDYLGIDLSDVMIRRARRRYRGIPLRRFAVGDAAPRLADYAVASGVMNVQLDISRVAWEDFIAETLRTMRRTCRRGFAVNFLDPIPAEPASRGLYRTEPGPWAHFCRETLGCSAEIVRGYGMREFTLLARPDLVDTETTEQITQPVRRPRRTLVPPRASMGAGCTNTGVASRGFRASFARGSRRRGAHPRRLPSAPTGGPGLLGDLAARAAVLGDHAVSRRDRGGTQGRRLCSRTTHATGGRSDRDEHATALRQAAFSAHAAAYGRA
jgi:SAM-dependent methyltransferase